MDKSKIKNTYVVAKNLKLPDIIFNKSLNVTFKHEIDLRFDKQNDNRYDPERSRYDGQAIIGNIMRRYLPGVQAMQIAEEIDSNGKHWKLVLVPEENDMLCTFVRIKANLGWIKE